MSTRDQRVKELFDRALERPTAERAAFLDDACGDETGLRSEIETLLWVNEHAEEFLADRAPSVEAGEQAGAMIGRYKLRQQIGEGGFGVVWLAEQFEPVRRKVALKVIKLGMDTRRVIARFEAERQALALMDHPNIAKVLDGGATESGRPYFVMDLVKGLPITDYCDQTNLPPRERILLLKKVCDAIQHAHQKGVVHRDLKPSNILVALHDGNPVPKVIDFGIAKATNQELTQKTLFTELRQMVGTPEYMAPEQAELSGLDVDTRADVYSLGVILYELLTGTKPFELRSLADRGYGEMVRHIREVDPPKPSTRVSTLGELLPVVARQRRIAPDKLGHFVRGELDWIVMKALEKDRTRRYPTANALGEDLDRYLSDVPILAGPPSTLYRVRKLVKRHRAAVVAASSVVLMLIAFAVVMAVQAQRIAQERDIANRERDRASLERDRANREAETTRQVSSFMRNLFRVSDPSRTRGETVTAREILDRGAARIDSELADQPVVRARMLETIGDVYRNLGLIEEATTSLRRAVDLRRATPGTRDEDLAQSMSSLATVLQDAGALDRSEELFRDVLEIRERLHGRRHRSIAGALNNLALVLTEKGDLAGAELMLREALELRRSLFGDEHQLVAATMNNLAQNLNEQGKYRECEPLYREALALGERRLGPDHPTIAAYLNNLAIVLRHLGELDEAEAFRRRSTELARKLYGDEHPRVAADLNNLGSLLRSKGDHVGAEEAHRASLQSFRNIFGEEHPSVAKVSANLARSLYGQGRLAEAEELLTDTLDRFRRLLGPGHYDAIDTQIDLARVIRDGGDLDRAGTLFEDAAAASRAALPAGHVFVARALEGLGSVRLLAGAAPAAAPLLAEAIGIYRAALPADHWHIARAEGRLGAQLAALGDRDAAEPLLVGAYRSLVDNPGVIPAEGEALRNTLVALYEDWGRPDEAARYRSPR